MKEKVFCTIGLFWMLFSLCGCAGPYSACDYRADTWGEAFQTARDLQILNPDAAYVLEPVEGMDGPAAEKVYGNYVDGFKSCGSKGSSGSPLGFVPVLAPPGGGN